MLGCMNICSLLVSLQLLWRLPLLQGRSQTRTERENRDSKRDGGKREKERCGYMELPNRRPPESPSGTLLNCMAQITERDP